MKNYQERWIHKFELKKDKWVYVPSELTRSEGIKILNSLSTKWAPPVYFYHFRKGGHIEALKVHLDSYYFAYIDLKGFFNSTSRSRVSRALKEFYSYEQARNIARMSTIKNPTDSRLAHILPFGFLQSPMLATLCLHKSYLGNVLLELFNKKNVKISVYMDDIVISADDKDTLDVIYCKLIQCVEKSKYIISDKRTPPSTKITVFNIEIEHHSLRITQKRMLEFLIEYIKTKSPYVKKGILTYIKTVNLEQYNYIK